MNSRTRSLLIHAAESSSVTEIDPALVRDTLRRITELEEEEMDTTAQPA